MVQATSRKTRIPVHGVLLLDKPAGLSSNDALIKAKRLLNAAKAGHTGTLDPFATGLLPLCFGEATKFSQDLLEADKTYETVLHLGMTTTTGDTEGEVMENKPVDVSIERINEVITRFQGRISQVPPMHSALKRDGKPLYEYARAGITLEREARNVTIHELSLLDYASPFLRLRVRCSKGTYIRVLGMDIGEALGCGAHLNALRRTEVGMLSIENAVTLNHFSDIAEKERMESLAPVDALLSTFPVIALPAAYAERFMHGQRIALDKENLTYSAMQGRVRVYRSENMQLLGTAQLMEYGILAPERLVMTSMA